MMSWQVRFSPNPLDNSLQRECLSCVTCPLSLLPVGLRPTKWRVGSPILALLCLWGDWIAGHRGCNPRCRGCCSVDTIPELWDERHWE